jgi:hypothetical protein
MTVFWDVAPCSLVEVLRRFGGAYRFRHQGDEVRLGSVNTRRCENLKSYKMDSAFPGLHCLSES